MIRVGIVEDDKTCQEQLKEYLQLYGKEKKYDFHITMFEDGIDLVEDYHPCWDIIFMDIRMKYMNGMDSAREIRKYDQNVIIIFITTMAKFAIKGYEVDALDFILKPVKYTQFSIKMNKAINYIEKHKNKKNLLLPIEEKKEIVSINEILFIEVKNHDLHFVTRNKIYVMRCSMREIEKELELYHFIRCNQCYLVNLKNVTAVQKDIVLLGEYKLPISRSRKKQFLKELSDYIGKGYK